MTLLSSTDEQLLREGAVRIPQLDTGIPLKLSYIFAPLIFLFLHLAFMVQMYLLARKLRGWSLVLGTLIPSQQRSDYRLLLSPFPLTQILGGEAKGQRTRWPLHFLMWATTALVPVLLLLAVQISFVRYHSEGITLFHRLILLLDLGALAWFVWNYRTMWREQPPFRFRPRPVLIGVALILPALLVLRVSWWDGWIPGSAYDRESVVASATDVIVESWMDIALCPWDVVCRHLDLRDKTLVARAPPDEIVALYIGKDKTEYEALRDHAEGLDLQDRDLRHANFTGAKLPKAKLFLVRLQGSDLGGAELQGSDLGGAELQGANLREAQLQGVNLRGVWLGGADLREVAFNVADLRQVDFIVLKDEAWDKLRQHIQEVVPAGPQLKAALKRLDEAGHRALFDRIKTVQAPNAIYDRDGLFHGWPAPPSDEAYDKSLSEVVLAIACADADAGRGFALRAIMGGSIEPNRPLWPRLAWEMRNEKCVVVEDLAQDWRDRFVAFADSYEPPTTAAPRE